MNPFGQPLGPGLPGWTPPPRPGHGPLDGRWCRCEPLRPAHHGEALFAALDAATDGPAWTYLPYGPFADRAAYQAWLEATCTGEDPRFFALRDRATERIAGLASWLRITPASASIEVGHIHLAPAFQRSRLATEAMALMMGAVFALGYRRYEWKCDALNAPSRAAALRLGFSYEGTFRQATVYKGRNRDTAWYAVTDREWPALRQAFAAWLDPGNFDDQGRQRTRLSDLTRAAIAARP